MIAKPHTFDDLAVAYVETRNDSSREHVSVSSIFVIRDRRGVPRAERVR
jgi:hypothetical protein